MRQDGRDGRVAGRVEGDHRPSFQMIGAWPGGALEAVPSVQGLRTQPPTLPVPTRPSAPAPSALDPRTLPGGDPQGRVSSEVTARVAALFPAPPSPPPHCFHPR